MSQRFNKLSVTCRGCGFTATEDGGMNRKKVMDKMRDHVKTCDKLAEINGGVIHA